MSTTVWDREFDEQQVGEDEWLADPDEVDQQKELPGQDVVNLLNLGELKARMEISGHEVWLRTLKVAEELEIGVLVQPYMNTIEEGRALATATVAASIDSLDGKPLVENFGPGDNKLRRKFDYVRTHMYWPVIKILYEEAYIPLVTRQVEAIEEFRKK